MCPLILYVSLTVVSVVQPYLLERSTIGRYVNGVLNVVANNISIILLLHNGGPVHGNPNCVNISIGDEASVSCSVRQGEVNGELIRDFRHPLDISLISPARAVFPLHSTEVLKPRRTF
ncbi:hypothetical protein D3C78_963390 [compost metagenome]